MALQVHQFICLSDNFGLLVHDPATGATASIDAPDGAAILAELAAKGWTLTDILVTHHHADHTQGIPALKARFPNARVVGAKADARRIDGLDALVAENDEVSFGGTKARVIETPGHTSGHIAYHFADDDLLFCGDTLFALGCGRVFEGTMPVMYHSLMKLAALPEETQIYCGHEYTQSNARFALTVDPDNALLKARAARVDEVRGAGAYTLPSTIGVELATNPFLRAEDPGVQKAVGMSGHDPVQVFAEVRERKNRA
ncbi:MAG: hydroxyacylglutathione hydrolase [Hyphomicrobiales bacterium]|nr:hydroxyacylglutathione hydrolase [Hyphomicrobiales bacterium]